VPFTHWLDSMVAPLDIVLFHFGQDAVTWAELLGFGTGALGVWLTVRFNIWNFPIGSSIHKGPCPSWSRLLKFTGCDLSPKPGHKQGP